MPARMILALMLGMLVLPACQQDEPPLTTESASQDDQDEPQVTTESASQDDQDEPQVTWESYSDAGLEAQEQARYAEAEQLYLEALKEAGKFGEQDPRQPTSLNNLASLYYTQGRYAEAETLYQRVLTINEEALGPEHPDVATTLDNLAGLYYMQGKYSEAETLYQRALAIDEKVLGAEPPDVAPPPKQPGEPLQRVRAPRCGLEPE